ncbi:hypothetical protein P7K49_022515 [Saguinus oedipus]|uniref:Uncharacterized protein n=1 Tax=Saguinus oedipus TaxID=9490 RepID=A0ABQ9UY64_SAGOE|nr:hypothetical protein P7K49_022515 [Saguinus oedipus]
MGQWSESSPESRRGVTECLRMHRRMRTLCRGLERIEATELEIQVGMGPRLQVTANGTTDVKRLGSTGVGQEQDRLSGDGKQEKAGYSKKQHGSSLQWQARCGPAVDGQLV